MVHGRCFGAGQISAPNHEPFTITHRPHSGVETFIETRKPYGILKLRETFVVREATKRSMRANRGRDTGPELRLRRALWAAGLRGYRVARKELPGKPDVTFGPARLAVFVHGCFWHRCPHCPPRSSPKTNRAYWEAKFDGNVARDARQRAELEALGWRVMVVWECQLRKEGLAQTVEAIGRALAR